MPEGKKTNKKIIFTRPEMFELNKKILLKRGVTIDSIAEITFQQQSKYTDNISRSMCVESVEKILSLRDVFHHVQLACDVSGLYGTIGQTNFGDIDVNKHGIVKRLNDAGKEDGICHTFLDDIVGAIAAAASTRVAQVTNEEIAHEETGVKRFSIFDI